MNKQFQQQLEDSLYIHRPLPLHEENSREAAFSAKQVQEKRSLYGGDSCVSPRAEGIAELERTEEYLRITAPLRTEQWPEGATPDGDYSNFGTAKLLFSFDREDWQAYNRLRFWVRPQIRGARILHLNVSVINDGEVKVPDPYYREGATVFDLKNEQWNECIWEFSEMPRDCITQLCFYVFSSGHDIGAADVLAYDFRDIAIERVAEPEHEHGWCNPQPCINLSTVGYWPEGRKTAVGTIAADRFELIDSDSGKTVFSGPVKSEKTPNGEFDVIDFSDYTACGSYYLKAGSLKSCVFEISEELAKESLWKVLNFFFCERCGFPVPGKHGTCHQDITATHNGVTMSFAGGWHDAGDVSQQAAQTGEVVQAMFENARRCKNDKMLYLRLMEEAQWGLDFIMRTRFGDGYRATSAGATRITDNLIGNFDDIKTRVHNHSYENFLFSGIEAYAAKTLEEYDKELASNALATAKEDFAFAEEVFAQTGVHPAHMFEHTYNSGLSQYYAVIVWAASCLYEASGEMKYADTARKYANKLIACQEQGDAAPLKGFFYRDETHSTIVHFNHQAREHQFMQALESLCRSQPEAEERPCWENSMQLYGDYIKAIAGNTAPYGMLPAGIHKLDEIENAELFPYLHVTCSYEKERENYREQLMQGRDLGDGYILRNFPVWFSFRGNTAVMLSMGKAAALLGRYFEDKELLQIAREQMYWMWGKNPFGQSLIYGAGSDYCRQYAVLCGECVGEIPVGVETRDNEDVPYWPQNNNATFREVWVGAACRWLQLCADCFPAESERE